MLSEIYHNIYCLPISMVVLIMLLVTLSFSVGIAFLDRRWPKQSRIICFVLSVLFVFFILCLTVLNRNVKTGESPELIPFSFLIRAQEQPELYREVLMNMSLFWPLGLLLPWGIEEIQCEIETTRGRLSWVSGKYTILITILFAFFLSITIETLQYIFALGLVETDDVIANTVGAAIGSTSFMISRWLKKVFVANEGSVRNGSSRSTK